MADSLKAAALAVAQRLRAQTLLDFSQTDVLKEVPGSEAALLGGPGTEDFLMAAAGAAARAAALELSGSPDGGLAVASRTQKDRALSLVSSGSVDDPVEAACLWTALRRDDPKSIEHCARAVARRRMIRFGEEQGAADARKDARRAESLQKAWQSSEISLTLLGQPPSTEQLARMVATAEIVRFLSAGLAQWCGAPHPNRILGFVVGVAAFEHKKAGGLRQLVAITRWHDAKMIARHFMLGNTIPIKTKPLLPEGAARKPDLSSLRHALNAERIGLLECLPDPGTVEAIMVPEADP